MSDGEIMVKLMVSLKPWVLKMGPNVFCRVEQSIQDEPAMRSSVEMASH